MKENIILRQERKEDYNETINMVREAFFNYFVPGCAEHYLLHHMRDTAAFIPELSIVATHEGRIIGHVAYMRMTVEGDDGVNYEVAGLGPICVAEEYRRQGLGSRLINYSRDIARQMGFRAVFLFGDPDFYGTCGFIAAEEYQIRTKDNQYTPTHQVYPLYEGALDGLKGRYVEDPVFDIDLDAVAEFDKGFPEKALVQDTPSQLKFKKLISLVRDAK